MNPLLVYVLLLKANLISFSGLASLPIVHSDFVQTYHVLTERQLNTAVAAGRSGPGPAGIYIVSVGYMAAGVPGAIAGYLAVITPAFLVIPLLRLLHEKASHPRLRSAIRAILLSAAGLLLSASIPLGRDALTGWFAVVMAGASFALLSFTKVETLWVILAAAAIGAGTVWMPLH